MFPLLIIALVSLALSFLSALLLKRKGYPFWRTFVSSFIGITAVLTLVYNLVRPYL